MGGEEFVVEIQIQYIQWYLCVHAFEADPLGLDKLKEILALENLILPLSAAIDGLYPIYIGISTGSHKVEISWIQLVMPRSHCLAASVLFLLLLYSFCPLFCNVPRVLGIGVIQQMCQLGLGTSWSLILCILTSCGTK